MVATNYFNSTSNCSSVNAADLLQNIYIYNATAFKQHDLFTVSVSYDDDIGNYQSIGTAYFDAPTNRIIYDATT